MTTQVLQTNLYDQTGKVIKTIKLNPDVFAVPVKTEVVHQVAVAQNNNSRIVLAHTKDRSEVRGGGAKPWRQKGTGRARHGSRRSPIWVGGGVTFGPTKDRNFTQKINKKTKTKALFMCLTDKVSSDLVLLDKLSLAQPKTKDMVTVLQNLIEKNVLVFKNKSKKEDKMVKNAKKNKEKKDEPKTKDQNQKANKFDIKNYKTSALIVFAGKQQEIVCAGRNLAGIKLMPASNLNVLDLLKYEKLIMTEDALELIDKTFLKKA